MPTPLRINLLSAPQRRLCEEDERPLIGLLSLSTAALLSASLWAAASPAVALVSPGEVTERVAALGPLAPGESVPSPDAWDDEVCAIGFGDRTIGLTGGEGFAAGLAASRAAPEGGVRECRRHLRGCQGGGLPITLTVEVRDGRLHSARSATARSVLSRCLALDMLDWRDLPEGHHAVTFYLSDREP